jgi:HEAT repeat protein
VAPPIRAVAPLLGDRALRPAIFRALGASDEPAALDLLAGGLAERPRAARHAALGAIGQQRARRGLADLARLADGIRAAASHEPGAADACVAALASDDPFVPVGALTALAWIAEPRHVAAMARAAADDRLRPLVEEALDGLPRGTELMSALGQVLAELPPLARLTVRGTLALAGSLTALQALVDAAGDPDPSVQAEAVAELGRVGDARVVPSLAGLLGDDQPALSGVAAAALIRVGQRSAEGRRAVLMECRARAASGPSSALFRVLGAVGEGEDLRLVREGLGGGEVARRMAAAGAVAALGARGVLAGEPVPELVAALSDPAWQVRAAAARAFVELAEANAGGRLGDPEAGEHPLCAMAMRGLAVALDDAEPAVRAAAVEALGACGRPEHAPRITALAADPAAPPVVAMAALQALGRLGAADPWVIERGLAHPDAEVVKQAVAAAARLPGPDGGRLLREAAASPRWDVRHAAARGMAERRDPALREDAARLARSDPDTLVARAFAEAATLLAGRSRR